MPLRRGCAENLGVDRGRGPQSGHREKLGGDDFKRHFTGAKGRNTLPLRARRLWTHADVGLVESEYLLATTGRGNGRWNGRQLKVTQDASNHRFMGDGGNDAQ